MSCIVYKTNPVYFQWNYQLVPVLSHNEVYVKTSGIEYKVTDTLVVQVEPKILNCAPLLGVVKQSTTQIAPVVTSTTTPIDTSTSLNTNMSLCTCHPEPYTFTVGRDFASVIRSLRINKTALSSYKRKRMSVHDDRTSCMVMGYVAAIVIFGSISYIIIMDIPIILRNVTRKRAMTCYTISYVIRGTQTK
ncbi:uncharacterized protein LOC110445771 [Mizuhopecten yessoensis]|uniref:uncharacterized protein LOC110445771 n=1 Tax=Mizuhopecten yessoensis TaxID=6573 RepID=UPI000B45D33C|nr:uncharacterized protein LOC110445771 [Mizuhopecten yessoensis]